MLVLLCLLLRKIYFFSLLNWREGFNTDGGLLTEELGLAVCERGFLFLKYSTQTSLSVSGHPAYRTHPENVLEKKITPLSSQLKNEMKINNEKK